jgi:hypothetical protein
VSSLVSFGGFLPFSYASDALSVERLKLFIRTAEEEEGGGSWRFHPRSCVAEGIQNTVAELNGSRTNRVFEFFKINPPERFGFARHREAAERKAAALAAAEADADETATSPRVAPKKTGRRGAPAAATATAEGGAEETRRAAGGLSPITQEDPTH